jgi:SAM-dependent methyltransferase
MNPLQEKHLAIQNMLRHNSPYDAAETDRIISKFFGSIPRLVRLLVTHYHFDQKKILDVGSSYGQSFFYWGNASEATDVSEPMLQMIHAQGRIGHLLNVENGFPQLSPESYDGIFTNNLLEHLVAPHLFLARLHALLKPGGILAIGHPVVPPSPLRQLWRALGYGGWLEQEHINFFTPATAKLTLERGGFSVVGQHFSPFCRNAFLSRITVPFGIHCLSVCTKIQGYRYQAVRKSMFDPVWAKELNHFR